ncbi:MAG: hypothetical protein PWP23_276 [Candidatus Sumerlaeota bacterium]|nr:hypothetical protein [Candidatus Sumerlaeota bacterium]
MRKVLAGLAISATLVGAAFAQVTLDDFEADIAGWAVTAGYGTVAHTLTDGANSTSGSLVHTDGGFSYGAEKVYTAVVPSDGNYKVTFLYKNGDGDNPMVGLKVFLNGANAFDIPAAPQTAWTAGETGIAALTAGDDVTIEISTANNGPAQNYNFKIDEIVLEPVAVVPITATLRPLSGYFIDGTTTLTVSASGGTGTFTKAEFDVNNDSTIDYTDSTPGDGLTYDLDTTALSDGDVDVRVIVTDDSSATGEDTVTYTVANYAGVVDLFADGFESWTAGNPDNWIFFNADGNGTVSGTTSNLTIEQDTTDFVEGTSSLKITFAATDTTNRYTYRTPSFDGALENYIVWYWGKGGSDNRMYIFSSDDEVTWVNTFGGASSSSTASAWAEVQGAPYSDTGTVYKCVATHKFSAVPSWWDDVKVIATNPTTPAAANTWDLYE